MMLKEKGTLKYALGLLLTVVSLMLIPSKEGFSQNIGYYKGNDCSINTADDVSTGCTSMNYLIIQYQKFSHKTSYAAGWTLKVRANADFSNGSSRIAAQNVSIKYNSQNEGPAGVVGSGYKQLGTSDVALISTTSDLSTPPIYYFEQRFDIRIQGGSHLLAGAGTYSTSLTLSLIDKDGNVITTNNNVQVSFVVNYSNTCSGATIGSYFSSAYTFTSYEQQMEGATSREAIAVQYNPNKATCTGWSLKVRAASNFTNGSSSVPFQYLSVRFSRVSSGSPTAAEIGVTDNITPLTSTDVPLINRSNAGFIAYGTTEHKFDLIIQGGNHLLVPNGTYIGTIIFSLFNQDEQLVSTTSVPVSFAINSSINSYTLILQNSSQIDMLFNTAANYTNGVSVNKIKGLKIVGNKPHQVIVKTGNTDLTSASSSNRIPVSAVNLEVTKNKETTAGIVTYNRPLAASDQIFITNPLSDYTQREVEYDLRYYTKPGDKRLQNSGASYSTDILFIVIPQ